MSKPIVSDGERAKLIVSHIAALEALAHHNGSRYTHDCFLNFELMSAMDDDKAIELLNEYCSIAKDKTAMIPNMIGIMQPAIVDLAENLIKSMKSVVQKKDESKTDVAVVAKDTDPDLEKLR